MTGIGVSMTLGVYERAKFLSIRLLIVFFITREELELFTVWEGSLAGTLNG